AKVRAPQTPFKILKLRSVSAYELAACSRWAIGLLLLTGSKLQAQRELHLAAQPGAGDRSEVPCADLPHRRIERPRIGEIVVLPEDLDPLSFGDEEILEHRKIDGEQSRRDEDISPGVPIVPAGRNKGRRVEPAARAAPVGVEPPIGDAVGPACAARAAV